MSVVRGQQVANWANAAADAYLAEHRRLNRAEDAVLEELNQLAKRRVQAWEQLTVTLVPGLVAEHLDWVAHLIHLPAVAASAVHERIAAERRELQIAIEQLEADPDFIDRELKINECEIHIDELERPLAPLIEATTALRDDLIFQELIMVGYGTDAYLTKWWELAYYRHWKHGDRLVEAYGEPRKLMDFAALRGRYEQELAARRTLESEVAGWVAERARVEGLAHRHAKLQEKLATVEDRQWTQTRARVHEHLAALASDDLLALLADYEPGLYAGKRIAGIDAKRRYLEALHKTWIEAPNRQVKRKYEKAKRGAIKYRRTKHYSAAFGREEMRRKYQVPTASWDKRWHKYEAAYQPIVAFDRYDDYRPSDGMNWWHLMTAGAVKARFIPDVDAYYSQAGAAKLAARGDAHEAALAAIADQYSSPNADTNADANFDDWS